MPKRSSPIEKFAKELSRYGPALQAWGDVVTSRVVGRLATFGLAPTVIKIEPKPRVKAIESALGKVQRKGYDNPLEQMTDLVGTRFVVLLINHVSKIGDILKSFNDWDVKLARDFLEERKKSPTTFDYQSQHYEVRNRFDLKHGRTRIPAGTCCEVQIRTLLQHAYAELTHDGIYKDAVDVTPRALRLVARSVALMETTDEIFTDTMSEIDKVSATRESAFQDLQKLYASRVGSSLVDRKMNLAVLDAFRSRIPQDMKREIARFLRANKFVVERIVERGKRSMLFAQPIIFFTYWLARQLPVDAVRDQWPLPGSLRDLELVLSDLGISSAGML
jgi:ppGpp synthetase/RelA/SpoT-type nucleotidyltranferase